MLGFIHKLKICLVQYSRALPTSATNKLYKKMNDIIMLKIVTPCPLHCIQRYSQRVQP